MLELGHDVAHDGPWWRKMLPHYLGNLLRKEKGQDLFCLIISFLPFRLDPRVVLLGGSGSRTWFYPGGDRRRGVR